MATPPPVALEWVRTRAIQLRRRRVTLRATSAVLSLVVIVGLAVLADGRPESHVRTVPAEKVPSTVPLPSQEHVPEDSRGTVQVHAAPPAAPPPAPLVSTTTTTVPRPVPTDRAIAFVRDGDVWLIDENGMDARPLTAQETGALSSPDWRPDGTALVATEMPLDAGANRPQSRLVLVSLDGTVRPLTDFGDRAANPKWSPDGTRIAYERRGHRPDTYDELWVVDADGSHGRRVVGEYMGFSISWSPDGAQVAYECGSQGGVCIVDIRSGATRTVPNSTTWASPWWAPDGRLAVVGTGPDTRALLSIRPDGSDVRAVVALPRLPSSLDWSPRADALVLSMPDGTASHCLSPCPWGPTRLYRLDVDDSELTPLTDAASDVQPSWSPVVTDRRPR